MTVGGTAETARAEGTTGTVIAGTVVPGGTTGTVIAGTVVIGGTAGTVVTGGTSGTAETEEEGGPPERPCRGITLSRARKAAQMTRKNCRGEEKYIYIREAQ